jgi:hypothetical protein
MNEMKPSRGDLSLHETSPLPAPGAANLQVDQPAHLASEPPGVLFGERKPRFEMPSKVGIKETAREAWEYTREQASDVASKVGHQIEEAAAQVTCWIRQHPGTSLLCGFSIGFLLADAIVYLKSRH